MTSVLNVDTIADKAGTGPVGLTKQSAAKHFVHFNGTGTISIYTGALNTSSISDTGTGNTTVTLTSSLSSADGNAIVAGTDGNQVKVRTSVNTTSTYDILTQNSSGSAEDRDDNSGVRYGDLA